jgi:hypothetical protein
MSQSNTKKPVEQDAVASLASQAEEIARIYEAPRIEKRERLTEITGVS